MGSRTTTVQRILTRHGRRLLLLLCIMLLSMGGTLARHPESAAAQATQRSAGGITSSSVHRAAAAAHMAGSIGALTLDVSTSPPGATVTAVGCGFVQQDSFTMAISTTATEVNAIPLQILYTPIFTGNGPGSFCYSVQFNAPVYLPPGNYFVFLNGTVSLSEDFAPLTITVYTGPILSLWPPAIAPGSTLSLAGSSFSPYSTVTIDGFGSTQTVPTTATAFTASLNVPAGTPPGSYTITAVDSKGFSASRAVLVTPPSYNVQLNPNAAAPGQFVALTGSGFTTNEQLLVALGPITAQPSPIVTTEQLFTVGAGGTFSAQYLLPASAAPGNYVLLVQGMSSGTSAVFPFIVLMAPPSAAPTAVPVAPSPVPTAPPPPSGSGGTASSTRYFAAGYTGTVAGNGKNASNESLFLYNPGLAPSAVTTTYAVFDPATNAHSTVVKTDLVAVGATIVRSVNADVGSDRIVSATVNAPSGITAEEVLNRTDAAGALLDSASSTGSAAPGTSWYLAEGYTGATFQEYLTIYNPGRSVAQALIQYVPSDTAAPQAVPQTVPAGGQVTINVRSQYNGLEPRGSRSIAAYITSDLPVVVDREMYWGDGDGSAKYGSSLSPAVAGGLSTQYFPLLPTSGGSQSFVTVLNPGDSAATLSLKLTNVLGGLVKDALATVQAHARYTFNVASIAPGDNGYIAGTLTSTAPVVAESALYLGGSPNTGRHPGMSIQGSSGFQIGALAALDNAGGVLQLYNPGLAGVHVQVTVGSTVHFDGSIPGGMAKTLHLSGTTPAQGVLVLAGSTLSATLLNGGSNSAPVWGGGLG